MTEQNQSQFINVDQAAEILRVHPETIRRLLRAGVLKGKKTLVGQWRIDRSDLERVGENYRPEGEQL